MSVDTAKVADLLAQSRAAHYRYQLACPRLENHGGQIVRLEGNLTAQQAAVKDALTARAQAETLDPRHTAPAWAQEAGTHPHGELLQFYREKVTAS